jgi:predicted amidophosphoribosyltransferase
MNCLSCNSKNPDEAKFCIECGAAMKRRCSNCGLDNLPKESFAANAVLH